MPKNRRQGFTKKPAPKPGFHGGSKSKFKKYDRRFKQIVPYGVKPEPFPRVLYTRCKFEDSYAFSQSTANLSVGWQFRMNNIYDPQTATGGKTVTGHAQLAAIYGRYWVTGAKVIIKFNNPSVDGTRVGVRLLTDNATSNIGTTLTTLCERPLTYISGLNDSGSQTKTFSFYIHPWTLCGVSKLEYLANSSTYSSVISGSPSALNDCMIEAFLVNPDIASVSCRALVKVIYYVKLYNRNTLASSTF